MQKPRPQYDPRRGFLQFTTPAKRLKVGSKSLPMELSRTMGTAVKIRSYGRLAELLGYEREILTQAPCTLADLRAQLVEECPEAAAQLARPGVRAYVDDTIVNDCDIVREGELLELLAPVSGG
jgi:molybdopterin converting factor small subunit